MLDNINFNISKLQDGVKIYNATITEVLKSYNELTLKNLDNISSNQLERLETFNKRM